MTNDAFRIAAAHTPPLHTTRPHIKPQPGTPQSLLPRYLAVWFPFLAADRLASQRRNSQRHPPASGGPDEPPLILVEKVKGALRIAATDARAARLGLRPGITLADARARIPVLDVAEDDAAADARFLNRLAQVCHDFTPAVALHPPDGVVLDITGCAHLFGGEAGLRDQACARLESFGLRPSATRTDTQTACAQTRRLGQALRATRQSTARRTVLGRATLDPIYTDCDSLRVANALSLRASVAGTPEAAWAFARFGRIAIVPAGADEAHARQLPVAALCVAHAIVAALSRAGLKTLGALADRSPAALAARFGGDLVVQLRRTLGLEKAPLEQLRLRPPIAVLRQFPEPLLHTEVIEDVLARLIETTVGIMEQRGVGGRRFRASFFHADGAARHLLVETGRPSRDARSILRLFHERLETLADALDPGFGFDAIELAVPRTGPLDAVQTALDGRTVEADAVTDLVDRLVARMGSQRVLRFEPRDTHDPDREGQLLAARQDAAQDAAASPARPPGLIPERFSAQWPTPETGEPPARPLQLFDPPQPIEALADVPDGPPLRFRWRRVLHEIARAEGPERIAPEWWRSVAGLQSATTDAGSSMRTRDYYRIEDRAGRRFWVFRLGSHGVHCNRHGAAPARWFMHGVFA